MPHLVPSTSLSVHLETSPKKKAGNTRVEYAQPTYRRAGGVKRGLWYRLEVMLQFHLIRSLSCLCSLLGKEECAGHHHKNIGPNEEWCLKQFRGDKALRLFFSVHFVLTSVLSTYIFAKFHALTRGEEEEEGLSSVHFITRKAPIQMVHGREWSVCRGQTSSISPLL